MEKVFTGKDSMEVHFVRNLLEAQGLRVQVLGEMLGAARGELPLTEETRPGIWVNSEDVERAMAVVDEFDKRDRDDEKSDGLSQSETWTCSGCGEVVEEQFSTCWKCQKPRNEQGESKTTDD